MEKASVDPLGLGALEMSSMAVDWFARVHPDVSNHGTHSKSINHRIVDFGSTRPLRTWMRQIKFTGIGFLFLLFS